MNINITLDVTPGTARRLAWLAVTLLLAGATAAAYAVPVTFVSQQKLTADQLNQNFDDLDSRVTVVSDALAGKADQQQVPIITEWQAYTPALTTKQGLPVENQETSGRYRRVGDTLQARVSTTFTGPPASGAIWWQWGLPEGLVIDLDKAGPGGTFTVGHGAASQGVEIVALDVYVRGTQTVSGAGAGAGSPYLADTVPVAFDEGGLVSMHFELPIQGWTSTQ